MEGGRERRRGGEGGKRSEHVLTFSISFEATSRTCGVWCTVHKISNQAGQSKLGKWQTAVLSCLALGSTVHAQTELATPLHVSTPR